MYNYLMFKDFSIGFSICMSCYWGNLVWGNDLLLYNYFLMFVIFYFLCKLVCGNGFILISMWLKCNVMIGF